MRKSRQGTIDVVSQVSHRKLLSAAVACALAAGGSMLVASNADARITKITVDAARSESPTFGGFSLPGIGQYEKIVGIASGELDPADPKNAVIVDMALAQRNAAGKVEYSFDFYILKPIDMTKSNHKMMYEPPNRGGKTFNPFNRSPAGTVNNDPGGMKDPSGTFLAPRGYTMVFSGWDAAAGTTGGANFNTGIKLPIAKNPDGSTITGPVYEYIVNDNATTTSSTLTYTPNSLDKTKAQLTRKAHLNDVPVVIPDTGWTYNAAGTAISLLPAGTAFNQSDIYEFTYAGKDPTVNGVGFAAIRDYVDFLKNTAKDDGGVVNPLAGQINQVYTYVVSQPGRLLNDFRWLGFNQAESGRKVFDGMLNWIAAGDGINMNLRFSQPGRTERNRQQHLYREGVFPFAAATMNDPITGVTDGRYAKCTATSTCPVGMEIYTANEYWVKAASLLHTDPAGRVDLPDHPMTRNYFVSSLQHGAGNGTTRGSCRELSNPLDSQNLQRALWIAMDDWVTKNTAPPPSMVPKFSDGTLVPNLPQSGMGFPNIPGVLYTGLKSTRYLFNYGPRISQGIMDINPPVITPPYEDNPLNGKIYPSFIPKTDSDGNDIAGVRLPDVVAPVGTYTGWALRSAAFGGPDGCESGGQYIPFATTKAARLASGDPRPSIEERYGNFNGYYWSAYYAVNQAAANRWLLPEDGPRALNTILQRALNTGISTKIMNADDMEDGE